MEYAGEDGDEHEERWPSLPAFHRWALGRRLRYTAYQEDEDGEWLVIEKGEIDE